MANEGVKLSKGLIHYSKGQLSQARAIFEEVVRINPKQFDALMYLGVIACQTKYWEKALNFFNKAIQINPLIDAAYNNRGNVLQEMNRLEEALFSYDKAVELNHSDFLTYFNRGIVLEKLRQPERALQNFDKAIELNKNYVKAYCDRGNVLQEMKQFEEAVCSYDKAIELKPDFAEAHYNRGNALIQLSMHEDAVRSFKCALDLFSRELKANPLSESIHTSLGNILFELNLLNDALDSYNKAIELQKDSWVNYLGRGTVFLRLKKPQQALLEFDACIALNQTSAKAFCGRGDALQELGLFEDAVLSYDLAIDISRDFAAAYFNRANALKSLLKFDKASENYEQSLTFDSNQDYLLGLSHHQKMLMCDWSSYDSKIAEILAKIKNNQKVSSPFEMLSTTDSLSLQKQSAEIWAKDKYPSNSNSNSNSSLIPKKIKREKIRIGYFSADFREHAVSYLTAELFEMHDKTRFEIFGFYFGPPTTDQMHKRVSVAFNQFIDVRFRTAEEIAGLCRDLEIDIAIDLTGNTANNRVDIFACRAAPVQLTYLGFLGTSGSDYFDYLIADKFIIPEESRNYYSEKIIYLPSYQVNDSKREISEKIFTKHDLNLPENSFVYCCFNSSYKINPDVFSSWMHILSKVDSSVLLIYAENAWVINNLRSEATKRGISNERLIFGQKMNRSDYLARYKSADLFLDTFPYNAGTTASDALWAGLPVLTRTGESFASRVASSLLNAIELPELITKSAIEYESLAIELANNSNKLKGLKVKLARNRLSTQLFDAQRFTRNIETAYSLIYERYQQDFPPDHIYLT